MTLIASFIGVDCKFPKPKPASIYIVSDSRISWGEKAKFDNGRKVFGCKNSPDIFGYCGDVLFPSIVLNQIADIADQGLLFEPNWTCKEKFQAVVNKLIGHYVKTLGAYHFGGHLMVIDTIAAKRLVDKYFKP